MGREGAHRPARKGPGPCEVVCEDCTERQQIRKFTIACHEIDREPCWQCLIVVGPCECGSFIMHWSCAMYRSLLSPNIRIWMAPGSTEGFSGLGAPIRSLTEHCESDATQKKSEFQYPGALEHESFSRAASLSAHSSKIEIKPVFPLWVILPV